MNDSADINVAAQSLQSALKKLEGAIDPLLGRLRKLEEASAESESFAGDRARLAAELDDAKADKEKMYSQLKQREEELEGLAEETTQELDRVIRHVQSTLEGLPS